MGTIDIKRLGNTLSIFFVIGFIACFIWGFTLEGDPYEHHLIMLRISYLKFSDLDVLSFISGLIQSYVWGWIVAWVFGGLWNSFKPKKQS